MINPEQLNSFEFNPLDATKVWPDVAMRKIGQMVLNRNPSNVFQETEQVALAPSNLVPGIEPSKDRLLQGRLFTYADTQMHRLGANSHLLPINMAKVRVNNVNQDCAMNGSLTSSGVNYEPSRLQPHEQVSSARYKRLALKGFTQQLEIQREQNFKQTGDLYLSYSRKDRTDLINTSGGALVNTDDASKHAILSFIYKANREYGTGVTRVAKGDIKRVTALAKTLVD